MNDERLPDQFMIGIVSTPFYEFCRACIAAAITKT